jgi:hypothetical protein
MTALIQFLIDGCWHRWVKVHHAKVWDADTPAAERPLGFAYICECQKCGMPKRFNLY